MTDLQQAAEWLNAENQAPEQKPRSLKDAAAWLGAAREEPIDLRNWGFQHITGADIVGLQDRASESRGVNASRDKLPFGIGAGFKLKDDLSLAKAQLAHRAGSASRDQELALVQDWIDQGRPQGFFEGLGEMGLDALSIMADLGLAAGTGGAGSGAFVARTVGTKGMTAATARLLGTAATFGVTREAGGRLVGPGGAGTANALRRALPDLDVSDEDAAALAELSDRHFAEEFLPLVLEKHPLWKGISEEMLSGGVEMAAGAALGRLPAMSVLRGAHVSILQKMGIKNADDLVRALENKVGFSDGLTELAEEVIEGAAVEGTFGDGPLSERLLAGVPSSITEAAQIMTLGTVIPAVAGTLQRAFTARDEARERALAEEQAPEGPDAPGASEPSAGGEATSAGEATAATAEAEPAVSVDPEVIAGDIAAFERDASAAAGRPVTFEQVEPAAGEEAWAEQFARRKGVEPIFVRTDDPEGLPRGYAPGEGRAVFLAGSEGLGAVAVHESMHTWQAQQTPEAKAELTAELEALDPDFVQRVQGYWDSVTPLQAPSAELRAEETQATAAEFLAPLVAYLDRPDGAADFARVYEAQPGRFRRTLEAVYQWIADRIGLLPDTARRQAEQRLADYQGELQAQNAPQMAQAILGALDSIRPVVMQGPEVTTQAQSEPDADAAPPQAAEDAPKFSEPADPQAAAAAGLTAPLNVHTSFSDEAGLSGLWDQTQKRVSDEFLAIDKLTKAARDMGADMSSNPESAVRRFFGKVSDRGERLKETFVDPIVKLLSESGIKMEAAGDHVYARHVEESNDAFLRDHEFLQELKGLRKRMKAAMRGQTREQGFEDELRRLERDIASLSHVDRRIPEGTTAYESFHEVAPLSGMKTSEAKALLEANAASEQAAAFRELGTLVDRMNRQTRDHMLRDGLLTADQHAEWSSKFKHYVPLRTAEVGGAPFPGRGAGFNIRGQESKRRKGRSSKADNPLVFSVQQAMRSIERGEKNAVGREFYDFAQKNRAGLEFDLNEDVEMGDDGKPALKPSEFHLKVDGRDVAVNVQDEELANALRRVEVARIPSFLRGYAKVQGVWRGLVTTFSPEFVYTNLMRDVQTALAQSQSVAEEFDAKDLRKSMRGYLAKSARATWQWRRGGEDTTGLGERLDEYRREGGRIGTFTSPTFEALSESLEKDLDKAADQGSLRKAARFVGKGIDVVEDANLAVETAARFALYNALRDRGVSAADSAYAARQLTTDFNQKGTFGSFASQLWVFASAAVGGNRRMLQELYRSKASRRFAAALVGYGFSSAMLNEFISDDDDDGMSIYSKMSEHEKARNHILMVPGVGPLKVPMPYGWSVFADVGRLAAEASMGHKSMGQAGRSLLLSLTDAFNPLGASPSFAQLAAPTFVDPLVQIHDNENFAGSPIRPQENPFAPETTKADRTFRNTSEAYKGVARLLNRATGGNDVRPGLINYSGDDVEHLVEFLGGGTARFLSKSMRTVEAMASGNFEARDLQAAPFVRLMYGSRTEFTDQSRFYDGLEEIALVKQELKAAKEAQDMDRVAELRKRHGAVLALEKRGKSVRDRAKVLKDKAVAEGRDGQQHSDAAFALMREWVRDYFVASGKIDG